MFFSFFIAKKYQGFKSKNNFVNLASKVSMFGIAIGTAALIIVLSVFNGFENLIIGMYNAFDPHLKVTHVEGKSFNPDSVQDKIKDNNIFNISTLNDQVLGGLILKLGGGIILWISILSIWMRWYKTEKTFDDVVRSVSSD